MKPFSLSVALFLAALAAQAEVVMVNGTIYDVNKGYHSNDPAVTDKTDENLCWAATSANLIQHWQDRYLTAYGVNAPNGTQTGYSQPSGTQYLQVYDLFNDNFLDNAGDLGMAVSWYFQGNDSTQGLDKTNGKVPQHAGYYAGCGISSTYYAYDPRDYYRSFNTMESFRGRLDEAFSVQGVGVFLGIVNSAGAGHAITCWGYETNGDGELVALYISDSDDKQFGARRIEVCMEADNRIHLKGSNPAGSYETGLDYIDNVSFLTGKKDVLRTGNTLLTQGGTYAEALDATGQQVTSAQGIILEAGAILASVGKKSTSISLGASSGAVAGDGLVAKIGSLLNLRDAKVGISHFAGHGMVVQTEAYVAGGSLSVTDNAGAGIVISNSYADNRVYLGVTGNDSVVISGNKQGGVQVHGAGIPGGRAYYPGTSEIYGNASVLISGNTSTSGAGVYAADTFSLEKNTRLAFHGNNATGSGGALASVSETDAQGGASFGKIHITGNTTATFENNSATGKGGAAYSCMTLQNDKFQNEAGIDFTTNTTLVFTGNNAAYGGAIASDWVETSRGYITVTGNGTVNFENNTASGTGGALYALGQLDLTGNTDITFTGNKANGGGSSHGGAAAVENGGDNHEYLTFSGNKNITFDSNSATGNGGAIYAGAKTVIAGNTGTVKFSSNTAGALGGAAYVGGEMSVSSNTGGILFGQNSASRNGGAIYVAPNGSLSVKDNASVTLSGNKAQNGSAIYATRFNDSGGLTVANVSVSLTGNTNVSIKDNVSSGGDIVYNRGNVFSLSGNGAVEFSGNNAGSGSVIHNTSNIAQSATGGYYTITINPVFEIAHNGSVTFSNNAAQYDIYNEHYAYISADKGQSITFQHGFKNGKTQTINLHGGTTLNATGGITYLGKEADGNTSEGGTYIFTDGRGSVTLETAVATVNADGGMVLGGGKLEVSHTQFASTNLKFVLDSTSLTLSDVTFVSEALMTVDFGFIEEKNALFMDAATRNNASGVQLNMMLDLVNANATARTLKLEPVPLESGLDTKILTSRQNATVIYLSDYLGENTDLSNFSLSLVVDGWLGEGGTLAIDTCGYNISEASVQAMAYEYVDRVGDVLYYFGKAQELIPEPATATLSLLALAGLCARRRRKAA